LLDAERARDLLERFFQGERHLERDLVAFFAEAFPTERDLPLGDLPLLPAARLGLFTNTTAGHITQDENGPQGQ